MKKIALLIILFIAISCGKEQHDLTVKGTVKGLKKGTVYLKKSQDTLLIAVDSLEINGNPSFELHSAIESPEMFYLFLDKNDNKSNSIAFFADKGITEINTTLKHFVVDAKINGSEQQKVLEQFKEISNKFNNKNLDLIQENFIAQKEGDSLKLSNNDAQYKSLLKRKYLYTVNFAITHKDSEVAPYLALTEIYNANITLLDTINNSLTPKVKSSKYGKELQEFIDKIKATE